MPGPADAPFDSFRYFPEEPGGKPLGDLEKGRVAGTIDLPAIANTIRFSDDDLSLFALGAESLTRWSVRDGARLTRFPGKTTFAMSNDRALVASLDGVDSIGIFDSQSGDRVAELPVRSSNVTCMDFSPDKKCLAVGTRGKTVHVWDILAVTPLSQLGVEYANLGYFSPILCNLNLIPP